MSSAARPSKCSPTRRSPFSCNKGRKGECVGQPCARRQSRANESGSHPTLCWREGDSNPRSRCQGELSCRAMKAEPPEDIVRTSFGEGAAAVSSICSSRQAIPWAKPLGVGNVAGGRGGINRPAAAQKVPRAGEERDVRWSTVTNRAAPAYSRSSCWSVISVFLVS